MLRRSFLTSLFGLGAMPFVPSVDEKRAVGLLSLLWNKVFPKRQKPYEIGWVVYEKVGVCILNNYAVAKVSGEELIAEALSTPEGRKALAEGDTCQVSPVGARRFWIVDRELIKTMDEITVLGPD